jgi:glycosyltransferase involved in cell wall biosynthesis
MTASLVQKTQSIGQSSSPKSVAFVARSVPHYRLEFLNGLEERLRRASIGLTVFADRVPPESFHADGLDQIRCAVCVPNYYFGLRKFLSVRYNRSGGASLRPPYWQPIYRRLLSYDLVIIEQSNSALLNYPLVLRRRLIGTPRIAFFGHGKNLQSIETGMRHRIKKVLTHQADHWFVYSELSESILAGLGLDDAIVTVVNNSVDTHVANNADEIDAAARSRKRSELGLDDAPVAVFCARLSENKALPFLIDACRAAREKFGHFNLLVIGDGYYAPWLRKQAETEAWIHPVGPLYGSEKAEMLALADIFLLPSANGLSILDSFAAGLPLLSARFGNHGPEIAYLKDGVNGLSTDATVEAYSEAIVRVLSDDELRHDMSVAARQSADVYSVKAMIENFAQGIEQALV